MQTKKIIGLVTMYTLLYIVIQEAILRFMAPYIPQFYYSDKFYLTIELLVMSILFIIAKFSKVKVTQVVKMQKINKEIAFIAVLIGCGMALLTGTIWYLTNGPGFKIEYKGLGLLFFLGYHLWNSFYKEVYFRGCIFGTLHKRWSLGVAIFIQGLIYGFLFMGFNIPLIISGYFSVIIFTLMYKWVDSIWAGVITQFTSTLLIYLIHSKVINIVNAQTTLIFSFLGIAILVYGLVWLRLSSSQQLLLNDKLKNKLDALHIVSMTVIVLMIAYYIVYRIHDVLWNTVAGYEAFIKVNANLFIASFCFLAVIVLAVIFKKTTGSLRQAWCIKAMSMENTLRITVIAIGISLFTTSMTSIRIIKQTFPVFDHYMDAFMNDMPSLPLQILCIFAIPILEEIIFRGIIFYQVKEKVNVLWGMIMSIGIYAFLQGNLWIGIYSILGSLVYTFCFILTRSLWGAVLVQVASAIMMLLIRRSFMLQAIGGLSDSLLVGGCILSGICVLIAFMQLVKDFKNRHDTVNEVALSKEA